MSSIGAERFPSRSVGTKEKRISRMSSGGCSHISSTPRTYWTATTHQGQKGQDWVWAFRRFFGARHNVSGCIGSADQSAPIRLRKPGLLEHEAYPPTRTRFKCLYRPVIAVWLIDGGSVCTDTPTVQCGTSLLQRYRKALKLGYLSVGCSEVCIGCREG